MNVQGQKTQFQGEKKAIFGIFLSKNGCFLVLAYRQTLLYRLQLTKHMRS